MACSPSSCVPADRTAAPAGLHRSHTQASQIGDLGHDTGECTTRIIGDGVVLSGKAADMHLVNDQIMAMTESRRPGRVSGGKPCRKHARRSLPGIRTRPTGDGPAGSWRREHTSRVWIEQDLLVVEPLPLV